MRSKNPALVAVILFIFIVVLGCRGLQSGSSPSSGPPPSQQPTQRDTGPQQPEQARRDNEPPQPAGNPFPDQQQPQQPADKPNIGGDNTDPSVLYGSWARDQTLNGMQCHAEYIFESTGTYSSLASCGSYMTHSVGTWHLVQPGLVRIEYTDHEPKVFGGQPVSYPTGESFTFTVINRNQLDTSGGMIYREL